MSALGIIPARMGSGRFPGKPLAKILGMPMVGHVLKRCEMAKSLDAVYVATCDQEIFDYVSSVGGKAVMTADTHERCTERTAEALEKIEKLENRRFDEVVMIQGDEPMTQPQMVEESLNTLRSAKRSQVSNLVARIRTDQELEDPNTIKVVLNRDFEALYFSRKAIPDQSKRMGSETIGFKQVCVISFKRDYLLEFNQIEPTPLEKLESVDMMRVLEHGDVVQMGLTEFETIAVDQPHQIALVEASMQADPLTSSYHKG